MEDPDATTWDPAVLAAAVDQIALGSDWLWAIGQEAAREWTIDRSMTSEEVALVRGLQMSEDQRAGRPTPFHAWWLDSDVGDAGYHPDWPLVWAAVVEHVTHPVVAAHLADLLWVDRFGEKPHLHARSAISSYLAPWPSEWQAFERTRGLMRAFDLAHDLNDPTLSIATQRSLLDEAGTALDEIDRDPSRAQDEGRDMRAVVRLLEHCGDTPFAEEGEAKFDELARRAWLATNDPEDLERISKLLLPRTTDEAEREAIVAGVIDAYCTLVPADDPFRRLMFMREALRVAEERGHPSHALILHEIETLDMDDAYAVVRTESTFSRTMVSDFCVQIVGADSLEAALTRFATQLTLTPERVMAVRDATEVSVRHLVTSHRIGEANSVVTSTETTNHDIQDSVERDVLRQVGHDARIHSFTFLVPALHQLLESYGPWDIADLQVILQRNAADATVTNALARGLEHFHNRRYDDAAHVTLPGGERLIRHLARACGVATTKRPTKKVGGIRGLGEILADVRGDGTRPPLLPEPLLTSAELTLVDADSLNLRNDTAHGITEIVEAPDAALILQLGLALALTVDLPEASEDVSYPTRDTPATEQAELDGVND